jgi:hypothetical protein
MMQDHQTRSFKVCAKTEALAAGRDFLHQVYGDGPPTIVMLPEQAVEHSWAWAVVFDSQEHMDTGDFTKAPLSRLIYVPKDGSPVAFMPTAFTSVESAAFLGTGQWPQRFATG